MSSTSNVEVISTRNPMSSGATAVVAENKQSIEMHGQRGNKQRELTESSVNRNKRMSVVRKVGLLLFDVILFHCRGFYIHVVHFYWCHVVHCAIADQNQSSTKKSSLLPVDVFIPGSALGRYGGGPLYDYILQVCPSVCLSVSHSVSHLVTEFVLRCGVT
jgi:hypothetical protein